MEVLYHYDFIFKILYDYSIFPFLIKVLNEKVNHFCKVQSTQGDHHHYLYFDFYIVSNLNLNVKVIIIL
jgi:hypothetical protein